MRRLHVWDLLVVMAVGLVAGTLRCAVGLGTAVLMVAFIQWDAAPLRHVGLLHLRTVLALGLGVCVWFTLSKEGRSEWWR